VQPLPPTGQPPLSHAPSREPAAGAAASVTDVPAG
jgi:hypothetical protein